MADTECPAAAAEGPRRRHAGAPGRRRSRQCTAYDCECPVFRKTETDRSDSADLPLLRSVLGAGGPARFGRRLRGITSKLEVLFLEDSILDGCLGDFKQEKSR